MGRVYRAFAGLGTALCILCAPVQPVRAESAVFTVSDVTVDITAKDAAAAREKAFAQAQQDAFRKLAEQILPEDELAKFTVPEPSVVAAMIKDYEITNEQLSRVEYVGTYTFRFDGDAVRRFMAMSDLSYADVSSKTLLALPFYQWGARTVLWGDGNPWLAAWMRSSALARGLVPVVVPIGDVEDVGDIADDDALTYDREKLQSMLTRYGAGDAVIMMATPNWETESIPDQPPRSLEISIYRTDSGTPAFAGKIKIDAQAGDTVESLYDRAASTVRAAMQSDWKSRMAAAPSSGSSLSVRVRFSSMAEWIEMQKALRALQGVNAVDLMALRPDQAELKLSFQGTEDRLRLALAQADMTLGQPQLSFANALGDTPLVYDLRFNKIGQQAN